MSIEVRGLSKRFGDYIAVQQLDIEIADGEFFVLLGPSGCGKSTTLRMIAGLDMPSAGRSASAAVTSPSPSPGTATSRWCSRTTASTRT